MYFTELLLSITIRVAEGIVLYTPILLVKHYINASMSAAQDPKAVMLHIFARLKFQFL